MRANRQGGLALSVLWTFFATGLLSAGLALRSRAPVIPAHISGVRYHDSILLTYLRRHRARVRYGPAVDLSELDDPKDRRQIQEATQKIWQAIRDLAPEDGKIQI